MSLSPVEAESLRSETVDYLRSQYLGPAGGEQEAVRGRPEHTYLVGTLYPRSAPAASLREFADDSEVEGPDGEDDAVIEAANNWHPSSAAMSFIVNGGAVSATVGFGTYAKESGQDFAHWRRSRSGPIKVVLSPAASDETIEGVASSVRVSSRWRPVGDTWLVTVGIENLREFDEAELPINTEDCLFQVSLECEVIQGELLPYRSVDSINMTAEERELSLRYRENRVYGVGHGASVRWSRAAGEESRISLDFLPVTVVPAVTARTGDQDVLQLSTLADRNLNASQLTTRLNSFVDDYENWVGTQSLQSETVDDQFAIEASGLVVRMEQAVSRMRESIQMLLDSPKDLEAFRVSMEAMREQILQTAHFRDNPGERGAPLTVRPAVLKEPAWRPFQLGFLLVSLASTADPSHEDRETVDLIWFPTGGGKTEAYLALAAFEMVRRRLVDGINGGGTAVITRYTLRLLTTQQFQRAATLICALQRLRLEHPILKELSPFTIGLWLGDSTTPNKVSDARTRLESLKKMTDPTNPFQLDACPWCATPIIPKARTEDEGAYGAIATAHDFFLHCTNDECDFAKRLPVEVIDEQIYSRPPSMLLATIDKFARLALSDSAGSVLGASAAQFDAPSLVIQDELHLLSGPIGTTMAVYEAAVEGVLSWSGVKPKIVASTATIRAAADQVNGLFARPVSLYPPSGISADDSYFARIDRSSPGRLYMGLMPQAFTQSSSVVRSLSALLEAPLTGSPKSAEELDAYWTVVAYHNSLRELGRTLTIARDDVPSLLQNRAISEETLRTLDGDGVVQLTSQESASELPKILKRLDMTKSAGGAVDVVVSTNMLSVGIDVARLGVMLMNGQPKTTSEYIQATSRVGRSAVPGIVVTLFRATKPRDRSHYESFQGFHESLYRFVEPSSVTPWSVQSRHRALAAALVILVRHGAGLASNEACAEFDPASSRARIAVEILKETVAKVDPKEAASSAEQIDRLVTEWAEKIEEARAAGESLSYQTQKGPSLLKSFGEQGTAWPVMNSMRSVDRTVRVIVKGEPTGK